MGVFWETHLHLHYLFFFFFEISINQLPREEQQIVTCEITQGNILKGTPSN